MIATIAREYELQMSHHLKGFVPDEHKCARLHGHTWRVEVRVTGVVVDGWFMDFAQVDELWTRHVHDVLDHRHLNDLLGGPATTENLCGWIHRTLSEALRVPGARIHSIAARENSRSMVEVRG